MRRKSMEIGLEQNNCSINDSNCGGGDFKKTCISPTWSFPEDSGSVRILDEMGLTRNNDRDWRLTLGLDMLWFPVLCT